VRAGQTLAEFMAS